MTLIYATLDSLIVGLVIFLVVRSSNAFRARAEAEPEVGPEELFLLRRIARHWSRPDPDEERRI